MNWIFLLSAAALVAVAMALLLIPMLRHAPESAEGRRPVWGAAALATILVAGSVGLYAWLGTPEGLSQSPVASESAPQSMDQAITQLERRLRDQPDNLEGWMLLGRSRMATGKPGAAASAYRRARELAPEHPEVLVALAEAIAQDSGNQLAGEPRALIEEALRRNPTHQRALWFAGIAAWQAGAYEDAVSHWETLLAQLDPDSEVAASVRQQLQAARMEAGVAEAGPPAVSPAQPGKDSPEPDRASVTANIRIADSLMDRYGDGDMVFVFARPASGPGVPLAVKRFPAGQLPATVTLGPDDAMRPENALTPDSEIIVGARISKSGSATPRAGDLEGSSAPIVVGDTPTLTVIIDQALGEE